MQGEIFVKKLMWVYGTNIKEYAVKLHKKFKDIHELRSHQIRISKDYEIDNHDYILTIMINEDTINENEPLKTVKDAVVPKYPLSTEKAQFKRHYHPSEHEKVIAKYAD